MQKLKCVLAFCFGTTAIIGIAATRLPATTAATAGNTAPAETKTFHIPIRQATLKNGLRIVLSEDHTAPTYTICVDYNVGSRNEHPGRTGFAHLFEHMMFEGSENVGKGEMYSLVLNNGGDLNGTTNKDRTVYYETLPSNQLDLGFFMEADRMRSLAITQSNLDNQRNAVQEERRIGVDNQPYGKTFEKLDELAYANAAYRHSVIGSMDDLNAASLSDVAAFFKTYYAPNNAVLVLVGDFNSNAALAKIQKYFGDIPRQPDPPPVDLSEPEQSSEHRATLEDSLARLARLDMVYKIPPGNMADWYALDVLGSVLMGGQSSRFYQEFVKDKSMAAGIFGGADNNRGPGLFRIIFTLKPGISPADVEQAVEDDIERVKKDGVSAGELEKTLIRNRFGLFRQLPSTFIRAYNLGEGAVNFNDPELVNQDIPNHDKVTLADVQRVAQKYLTQTNRTVVITVPKPAAPAGSDQ